MDFTGAFVALLVLNAIVAWFFQRRSDAPLAASPPPSQRGIKFSHIYYCLRCDELLLDGAPHGVCTACGSDQVQPVTWLLHQGKLERWLQRIGAGNGEWPRSVLRDPFSASTAGGRRPKSAVG